jgi:hypothetical protein
MTSMEQDSAVFLANRALSGAFFVGFVSLLTHLELFAGGCGTTPVRLMPILAVLILVGIASSACSLVGVRSVTRHGSIIFAQLSAIYAVVCFGMYGLDFLLTDRILIEAGLLFGVCMHNPTAIKFVILRIMWSAVLGKYLDANCDGSWLTFSSLKSDALNQPFPFTLVWHIAQLPDYITRLISALVVSAEVVLPVTCLLSRRASALEQGSIIGILLLCLGYYSTIGNFNWSALVLGSLALRMLAPSIVTVVIGVKTFARWGYVAEVSDVEKSATRAILGYLLVSAIIGIMYGILHLVLSFDLSNLSRTLPVREVLIVVLLGCFGFSAYLVVKTRRALVSVVVLLCGIAFAGDSYLSAMTAGYIAYDNDYSGLPTCYTFASGASEFPLHSRGGRSAFLFQTKYSEVGTNTVGSKLGGTRYAEMSVRGSVHGDEERPPFLIGYLPRLSLILWRMGTGNLKNVQAGMSLVNHLEAVVASGSPGISSFFPDASDTVKLALLGKENPIQAFYRMYEVTHRAADHQWWKRSNEHVAALPTDKRRADELSECQVYIPTKLPGGLHLETVLIMGVVAMLIMRILFTTVPGDERKKRK